jgi:hypothetical protein
MTCNDLMLHPTRPSLVGIQLHNCPHTIKHHPEVQLLLLPARPGDAALNFRTFIWSQRDLVIPQFYTLNAVFLHI